MGKRAPKTNRWHGLDRQRQSNRPKLPKGLPGWSARLRSLLWSWWVWAIAAVAAQTSDRPYTALSLVFVATFVYLAAPSERAPVYGLDHEFGIESDEFLSTIMGATDTPFAPGNRLDIYNNGDQFYPVMMDAISQAKESITIEAYIYWAGHVGRLFADALATKAREGVPVKILLDSLGSSTIGSEILEALESSGCIVKWYRPLHWYTINRINHRTHRKSLIIDGCVGFTGGAGIADHWMGNAEDEHHWRDIQIRVQGPAVISLQTGFAHNWLETTNELVSGAIYYPPLQNVGSLRVQNILSSPETGSSTIRIMYYLSIVCARKSILIANPYFIPDAAAIEILLDAKQRGVDVKIMLAGIYNDNRLARLNSIRLYGRLLEGGIEIYEYNRSMLHQKYMVCDGVWSTIGTTNFDNRSFALNEENSVCLYDQVIAGQFQSIFKADLEACDRIEFGSWSNRPLSAKLREHAASIFKDQA